jgi:signal transduction histidine kinase
MEILVNLIQNAIQAMHESGRKPGKLTLRIQRQPEKPGEAVRIEVQDSGMGIREENLTRVFHHGFTTKDTGHGFGLHTSANAATEMNSVLRVRSDGEGRGATFYLDIPMRQSRELAQAA